MDSDVTRRHQEDKPLTGAVENMRRLGLLRPRDLVPSPSLRRAARCWPSAGLRGDQWGCRRMFSGLWVAACHCGCTGDRSLFAPQSTCPGSSLGGRGHTCRTLRGTGSVSSAILTIRKVPERHEIGVPGATEVAVRAVLEGSGSLGAAVQRRLRKYSEVTGASVAGRAVM